MKKLISSLIVSTFILSNLPAFAAEDPIANETFDNYVTNALPLQHEVDGAYGTRVVENGKANKSLLLKASDDASGAYSIKSAAGSKFILEADLEMGQNIDLMSVFRLKDSTGKFCELLKYSASDSFMLGDGKSIRPQLGSKGYQIKMKVDTVKKIYNVYINGVEVASRWPLENTGFGSLDSVSFEIVAKNGKIADVKLDNVRIYTGDTIRQSFPSVAYLEDMVEFDDSITTQAEPETEVYFNQNFDKIKSLNGSGITVVDKGNVIQLRTSEKDDKNQFVYIERSVEDPFIDISTSVNSKRFVLSADITTFDNLGPKSLFILKDQNGVFCNTSSLTAAGDIVLSDGTVVGRVKKGEFANFALAINNGKKTVDAYFNGELKASGRPMANKAFGNLAFFRFQLGNAGEKTTIGIDNILLYSGSKPKSLDSLGESVTVAAKSVYPDDSVALKQLEGTVAFMLHNGAAFANGKKFFPENEPIVENGRTLLPVRLVAEAFGLNVDWNEAQQRVKLGTQAEFVVGDANINVGGSNIKSDVPPKIVDGRVYLPLRIIGEKILKKVVNWDERGFIVIGNNVFNPKGEKTAIEEAYNYLLYSRPKAAEILEKYNNSTAKGQHPKIYGLKEDFDIIREEIKTSPLKKKWAENLIKNAESLLNASKLEYALPDGLRMAPGYTLHDRVFVLAMAYQLTMDKKYADRAYFELESGAEFPDWNPKHFLDTSDMISAYGLAYDWCYDAFTEKQREFVRNTLKEKGLMAAYNSIYGLEQVYWTKHRHNWNAVCNGGIGLGAMAIMDDEPQFAADLIEKTLRGMEYMLDGFAPDGGWREGTSYWAYTNEFYAPYMALLDKALGTTFDYFNIPGVDKTGYYYLAMEGPTGTFNYSNNGGGTPNAPSLFWYADALNNPSIGKLRSFIMNTKNLQGGMYDLLWYKDEYTADAVDLPLDMSFREIETGTMRSSWTDKNARFVGYRGGRNNVEHTHYDKGSFVFDSSGIRWALDLGGDDYNMPSYFGIDNTYYRVRTEGHNTYVINPDNYRGQEQVAMCRIIRQESKPKGGIVVLDLQEAYKRDTNSAIRGYKLDERRNSLTIRDEIDKKDDGPLYWFMHTKADVKVSGNTAVLTQGGKTMRFEFVSNDPSAKLSVSDAVPLPTSPVYEKQNKNSGFRKLVIQSNKKGKLTITAKMYVEIPGITFAPVDDTPIESWTIDDGSINPAPKASAITLNGELISKFDKNTMDYVVVIDDLDNLPEIGVQSDYPYEVTVGDGNIVPVSIVVSDPTDALNKAVYQIRFKLPLKLEIPEGMVSKAPKAIKASENPQPENNDQQVYDNNYDTRWSAEGDVWLQYDLGDVTDVSGVGLSYYMGNTRISYFDVMVSNDGINFTTIGSFESSGETESLEIYTFKPQQARYVRFMCHGNSAHKWNSITEARVFGK